VIEKPALKIEATGNTYFIHINHCKHHNRSQLILAIFLAFVTWINCSANNTTKWIPSSVIKPVVKVVKSFF